jgi:hypothetical protein
MQGVGTISMTARFHNDKSPPDLIYNGNTAKVALRHEANGQTTNITYARCIQLQKTTGIVFAVTEYA